MVALQAVVVALGVASAQASFEVMSLDDAASSCSLTSATVRDLTDNDFTQIICPFGILVAGTTSFDGSLLDRVEPEPLRVAMSASTAAILRDAMRVVAEEGTARNLLTDGVVVGGKTGTAQLGTTPPNSHAWIVGYAGMPNERPSLAFAVIVEAQEGASEQTGGRVAAPIAQAVIEAAFP